MVVTIVRESDVQASAQFDGLLVSEMLDVAWEIAPLSAVRLVAPLGARQDNRVLPCRLLLVFAHPEPNFEPFLNVAQGVAM